MGPGVGRDDERGNRSPAQRYPGLLSPAYRCAHAGYLLSARAAPGKYPRVNLSRFYRKFPRLARKLWLCHIGVATRRVTAAVSQWKAPAAKLSHGRPMRAGRFFMRNGREVLMAKPAN